jgi:hypothetical protein
VKKLKSEKTKKKKKNLQMSLDGIFLEPALLLKLYYSFHAKMKSKKFISKLGGSG